MTKKNSPLRIGIVVPHIFMHRDILPHVIFSPGTLALGLANGLQKLGANVTLFSPGPIDSTAKNVTADLYYFEQELAGRDDTYMDLLKKHPFTFITLARQVQSELIAKAYTMANNDELDVVHIYTNEEDTALPMAALCQKPVVFTHHDPFNFLIKYKNVFPKYNHLNWISMSLAQRRGMPEATNWVGNIYHGIDKYAFQPVLEPAGDYVAYFGRIVQPKGVHLAIAAVQEYNNNHSSKLTLKIAGKHYGGHRKDTYWQEQIEPHLKDPNIQYVGYIGDQPAKNDFLANASALLVPSIFEEPFGMVSIEAMACGTPVIGLDSGALPEVIKHGQTGFIVAKSNDEITTAKDIAEAIENIDQISREACRQDFESHFTLKRMIREHLDVYQKLLNDD